MALTQDNIDNMVLLHKRWLVREPDGVRARLKPGTNLEGVDLSGADLSGATLSGVNLSGAYLYGVNLCGADLTKANLSGANMTLSNLENAKLIATNLHRSNLTYADLHYAILRDADLSCANLHQARLDGAHLHRANLKDTKIFVPLACPDSGAFEGWSVIDGFLVHLSIPAEARRCSATTTKCRCEFADVLDIVNLKTMQRTDRKLSAGGLLRGIYYKAGERCYSVSYDDDRWREPNRLTDIQFFINKQDALNHAGY